MLQSIDLDWYLNEFPYLEQRAGTRQDRIHVWSAEYEKSIATAGISGMPSPVADPVKILSSNCSST